MEKFELIQGIAFWFLVSMEFVYLVVVFILGISQKVISFYTGIGRVSRLNRFTKYFVYPLIFLLAGLQLSEYGSLSLWLVLSVGMHFFILIYLIKVIAAASVFKLKGKFAIVCIFEETDGNLVYRILDENHRVLWVGEIENDPAIKELGLKDKDVLWVRVKDVRPGKPLSFSFSGLSIEEVEEISKKHS